MMQIDFSQIPVRLAIEGEVQRVDIRRELGNYLYASSADIAMSDWGREVYYSTGAIAVPVPLVEALRELMLRAPFIAPVKRAVLALLSNKTETE